MSNTPQMPNRDAFLAFWKDARDPPLTFYGLYLGGLLLYVFVMCQIGIRANYLLILSAGAVAYVILVPYISLKTYWRKHDKFIRCPHCRDWLGRDLSGAWSGPNPKWKIITETGRCTKCGGQIIAED